MRSTRIPLWFGVLKIRHREQLVYEERYGQVPVWAIGKYRIAWWAYDKEPRSRSNMSAAAQTEATKPPSLDADSDKPSKNSRHPVVFEVGLRNGQWTIHFDGDYFGPWPSREEAVDAAYLMSVDAAAQGLDPQVRLVQP